MKNINRILMDVSIFFFTPLFFSNWQTFLLTKRRVIPWFSFTLIEWFAIRCVQTFQSESDGCHFPQSSFRPCLIVRLGSGLQCVLSLKRWAIFKILYVRSYPPDFQNWSSSSGKLWKQEKNRSNRMPEEKAKKMRIKRGSSRRILFKVRAAG